jgi:hypothetical protein
MYLVLLKKTKTALGYRANDEVGFEMFPTTVLSGNVGGIATEVHDVGSSDASHAGLSLVTNGS